MEKPHFKIDKFEREKDGYLMYSDKVVKSTVFIQRAQRGLVFKKLNPPISSKTRTSDPCVKVNSS